MTDARVQNRGVFGVILVIIGLAMAAKNFDLLPYHWENALFNWPMLLIAIGVILIFLRSGNITGWVLLLLGAVFWIPRVFDFIFDFHEVFWPSLFIVLGLVIAFRAFGSAPKKKHSESERDYLDDMSIFGGNERRVTSDIFKGGRITSVLGGSKINLMDAILAPGEQVLDMFILFGGTTLYVPESWEVKVDVTSLFGGFSDKRSAAKNTRLEEEQVLIIKGIVIFGGGELRN